MDTRFDPLRIAASLRSHGVDYVLVGDLAAAAHGSAVDTEETDILLPEDDDNLERLGLVLIELGGNPIDDGDEHRTSYDTSAGRLNLVETERVFEELASDSVEVDLGRGVVARVASVEHMVQLQRDSGDLVGEIRMAALSGAEFPKDDDDAPGDVAKASTPRFRDKIWGALESVDSFLTDLDRRGIRSSKR
jgi:hypothetical protein